MLTHQSATWAGETVKNLRNVPYPSSPKAVGKVLSGISSEQARDALRRYGDELWAEFLASLDKRQEHSGLRMTMPRPHQKIT